MKIAGVVTPFGIHNVTKFNSFRKRSLEAAGAATMRDELGPHRVCATDRASAPQGDQIVPKAGAFYVMDRGYIDFERLFVLTLSAAFFVVRSSLKDTVAPLGSAATKPRPTPFPRLWFDMP
jgi:hypothetical protein